MSGLIVARLAAQLGFDDGPFVSGVNRSRRSMRDLSSDTRAAEQGIKSAMRSAVSDVDRYAAANAAAKSKVTLANREVERSESRLRAARENGNTAKIESAEARLEAARARQLQVNNDARASEAGLEEARRQAAEAADGAAQSTERVGQASEGTRGKLAEMVAGGVAVGAMFTSVTAIGMDYERQMNTLQAVSGATAAQMGQVAARARELGNDVSLPGTSAVDAAAAMTELAKGGFSVEQSMDGAKGSLQLAAAAGVDAATAAGIQSAALQAFGKDASYAGHAADILSNTSNASSAEITDVAQALQQAGTVANGFGVNMADTATMIGLFANAGITGSDAGTLLKTSLQALTDQGAPAQAAIDELGLSIYNQNGQFVGLRSLWEQLSVASKNMSEEQFQAATNVLFGSDAMRAAMVAAGGGTEAYDKMAAAIGKQGTAAELAAAKMKGLPGAWERVQNSLESASLTAYGFASGALTTMANSAADMIGVGDDLAGTLGFVLAPVGALASAFGALPAPMQTTITLLGLAKVASMLFGNQLGGIRDRANNAMGALRITSQEVTNMQRAATVAGGSMNRLSGYLAVMGQNSPTVARMAAAYQNAAAQGGAFARMQGTVASASVGMRAGVSGLASALGGPWGLAITGAITALSLWMSKKRQDAATSQEAANRTKAWADQLAESGGQLTQAFKANVFKEADDDTKKLDGSGKSLAKTLKDMGVESDTTVNAVLKQGTAYDDVRKKLEAVVAAQTRTRLTRTGQKEGAEYLTQEGQAAKSALDRMNQLAGSYDAAKTKAQQTAEATGDLTVSMDGTQKAVGPMSKAMTDFAESTDGAASKADKLTKALDALNGDALSKEDALQQWSDGMRDLTKAMEDGGAASIQLNGHVDVTTEKGSALQDAIQKQSSAFNQMATSALASGDSIDSIRGRLQTSRDAFVNQMTAVTGNRVEAERLADVYGLIPDQVVSRLNIQGLADALNGLKSIKVEATSIPEGKVRVVDNTPENIAHLAELGIKTTTLPDGRIAITDTSSEVIGRLDALGVHTTSLPGGFVQIRDTSPENMQHLEQIGLKTTTLPNGMVVINANDAAFNEAIRRAQLPGNKDIQLTLKTSDGRVITNMDQLLPGSGNVTAGTGGSAWDREIGAVVPRADGALVAMENGGLRLVRKPATADIYAGRGAGTVFAEEATGGESYIPLAPGKRERSTAILSETARLFGLALVRPMENGGMTDDERARMGGGTVNASIWAALKGANPAAKLTAAKTDHDVDGGLHPKGEAIDVDPSPANLNWAWSNRDQLAMIISAAEGGQKNWYNMNGERAEGEAAVAIYGPDVVAQHGNHIHIGALHEVGGDGYTPGMIAANDTRSPEQRNIDAVIAEGKRRGMSPKQIKAAVMAVLAESGGKMYANPADPESMNMPHDAVGSNGSSTGIFQQQNNGAWGTLADRMDPTKSAGMFYDKLATVDQNLSEGQMAQAVQQSAFSDGANYTSRAADADRAIAESDARGNGASMASPADPAGAAAGAVQQVFVTNWPSSYGSDTSASTSSTSATSSGSGGLSSGRSSATAVPRAQNKVTTATTGVDDAKRRQADAAGRLRVAEMRLEEVRRKGGQSASTIARAEEGVEKARRANDSATAKVAIAERRLEDARKGLATAQSAPAGGGGVVGVGPLPIRAYATGDIASRGPGSATMLNSERMWVTRAREMGTDEAFIPVDGSPRSWALWLETGRRMGKLKEFGTGGFGGYTVDTRDSMAPKNLYDVLALGAGGAATLASVVAPYLGMGASGQVNLGDIMPTVDTGNNSYPGSEQLKAGADAISKQLEEILKALREGKNIHVSVANDNGPASMVMTRSQM